MISSSSVEPRRGSILNTLKLFSETKNCRSEAQGVQVLISSKVKSTTWATLFQIKAYNLTREAGHHTNMPRPRTPKEIKQFLGLTGYYRKFVPCFSEISRPLAKLTAKDTSFEWTPQCQFSFEMLKDALMSGHLFSSIPILRSPIQFLQMQANMGGLAYSLKNTHLSSMEKK